MKVAEDIVGLSIPLCFGVASATAALGLIPVSDGSVMARHLISGLTFLVSVALLFRTMTAESQSHVRFFLLYFFIGLSAAAMSSLSPGVGGMDILESKAAAEKMKRIIMDIPYNNPDTGALIMALTTGDKSMLQKSVISAFRDSGTAHILALSGLHLGIIYSILLWISRPAGNFPTVKKIRSVIIILICGYYTLATGAGASIVRAFLFITINETCRIFHRRTDLLRVFCAALSIQLLTDPEVISSIGFQLSYMAIAGIIFLYPHLRDMYPGDGNPSSHNPIRKVWDAAALTVSCQVFTSPVAWHYFRTFPQYFLIANIIAVPLTSLVMTTSLGTVFLSAIGHCPQIMVDVNEWIVGLLLGTVEIIAGMGG